MMNDLDQIDKELAEKVMGWYAKLSEVDNEVYWCGPNDNKTIPGWIINCEYWSPTRSIGQAFQVVERMRELGFNFCLINRMDRAISVCFTKDRNFSGNAEFEIIISEAISLAALKAFDSDHPKPSESAGSSGSDPDTQ